VAGMQNNSSEVIKMFCKNCGNEVDDKAEICVKCGVRVLAHEALIPKDIGWAAVIAVLFPGAGQVYNGQTGKGIKYFFITIGAALSILLLIGIVLFPYVLYHNIYDAVKTAEQMKYNTDYKAKF
jgi:TM2 domain-containing membrane protein YozV